MAGHRFVPYRTIMDRMDAKDRRFQREMARRWTDYRLPDGRIVRVDASAAKLAPLIDYTLADGRITQAVRADIPMPKEQP
jgi:hypothetical protein